MPFFQTFLLWIFQSCLPKPLTSQPSCLPLPMRSYFILSISPYKGDDKMHSSELCRQGYCSSLSHHSRSALSRSLLWQKSIFMASVEPGLRAFPLSSAGIGPLFKSIYKQREKLCCNRERGHGSLSNLFVLIT